MQQDQNIKGFTLLEILVVVAIIAIVSAAGYPSFSKWSKDRAVRNAADKVTTMLRNINSNVQRGSYAYVQVAIYTHNLSGGPKVDFITKFFGENEVDEIWLTFSDPQPKKPKKRLSSKLFTNRYLEFLKINGVIHLKTDSELLYDFTLEEIKSNNFKLLKNIANVYKESYENSQELKKTLFIKTFYEKKWLDLEKTIKYLAFSIH